MSDHLVRVANLKSIQRTYGWDDSELARQCGRQPQQVYAWFKVGPGSRQIGEKLARSIEDKLQLARYALDDRSTISQVGEPPPKWGNSAPAPQPATKRSREIPIIGWVDIDTMLPVENATLKQRAPHLESYAAASTKAKFLAMPDDSMAPDFLPGDHVLFDPTEAPRAGDVVLVKVSSGEHFVRTFKPRTAHSFAAEAINSHYGALTDAADGAIVVAVMVEHRRYRRA